MKQAYVRNIKITLITLLIFASLIGISAFIYKDSTDKIELSEGWQYRLGDSPKDSKGVPLWVYDTPQSEAWKSFNYPGQPPNEKQIRDVWVRVQLPQSTVFEPSLFFMTNDQFFEVYLADKQIYHFGSVEHSNDRQAPGSPWHLISLPQGYQGKMLSIRMHTMFPHNAGLIRMATLGSGQEQIEDIIKTDMSNLVISILFVLIGLFLMLTYSLKRSIGFGFLSLSLFSLSIGSWLFAESNIKQIFLNAPRIWLYVAFFSFYFMPVGFLSFTEKIFAGQRNRLIRLLWQTQIAFTLVTLLLDAANLLPIIETLQMSYILLFAEIITIGLYILKATRSGSNEAKIFILGFSLFALSGIYDILGWYFRVVPWSFHVVSYGMLMFVLSLVMILALRVVNLYDRLKDYSKKIESNHAELNQAYSKVDSYRIQLEEWNKTLEQVVATRTASVKNLMNNVGQGFLSFGYDLFINEEYSSECIHIFDREIARVYFPSLIYPKDEDQRQFLESIFTRILMTDNAYQRQKYLPLLPDEIYINNKYIHMDFKVIQNNDSNAIMVILTDITDKRCLESRMEQERMTLSMVVKVILNLHDFTACVKDYRHFVGQHINSVLQSSLSVDKIGFEIFRLIHTFKGCFSQYDLTRTVNKLHTIETQISKFNSESPEKTTDDLRSFIGRLQLTELLDEDLDTLSHILGEDFLKQENNLLVDKEKLKEIEKRMMGILPPYEYNLLLPDIQQLRFKPFKELLKTFPDYVAKLAERFEKAVGPLHIEGGDMLVDIDRYSGFSKALVHLFRNMVDHGLESMDDRVSIGKAEYGNICCSIELKEGYISLLLSDDGRGIDLEKIKQTALEKHFYDENTLNNMSEEDLLNIIFVDGFTTREATTELSGRGVGLSALYSEVKKLNGTIQVKTGHNTGTCFIFLLPYENDLQLPEITISDIINPVADRAKHFLAVHMKTGIHASQAQDIHASENLPLKAYTAIIPIKGTLNGKFVISVDAALGRHMYTNFLMDGPDTDEKEHDIEYTLAECANIIIGNALKMIPQVENLVMMGLPTTLSVRDASIHFMESTAWTYTIETDAGNMRLSFITGDSVIE